MELYKIFMTVSECQSLTLASKKLFISQPAISKAIKQLEDQLGCKLINRNNKGIALTYKGRILKEYLIESFKYITIAEERLKKDTEHTINIGFSGAAAESFLAPYISVFLKKHTNAKLNFKKMDYESIIRQLDKGELDIAIIYKNDTLTDCDIIKSLPLSYRIIANNENIREEILNLSALKDTPLVLADTYAERLFYSEYKTKINSSIVVENESSAINIVNQTSYLALVSRYAPIGENIKEVVVGFSFPKSELYVIKPTNYIISQGAEEFLKLIK